MLRHDTERPRTRQLRPARGTAALAAALLVLAVTLSACTGGGEPSSATTTSSLVLPAPTEEAVPVVTVPDGFVVPDTRGAVLLPFKGRPKSPGALPVTGGTSRISGTVSGPDGPVEGAVVRVERVVGDRSGSIDVAAGAGGAFTATGLLGGHYRLRAWLQPSLAGTEAAVTFLPADQGSADVSLSVDRFAGKQLQATLDVGDPHVGDSAQLRALYTQQTVDGDGIVVGEGIAGAEVQLAIASGYSIDGPNPATTASSGIASFKVTCTKEGSSSATVNTSDQTTTITLPACLPKRSTTTTTTVPDTPTAADFPIGQELTVPYAGPIPAGTYRTFLDGCVTSYEVWLNGAWQSGTSSSKVLTFAGPARNLTASGGTKACRYQRSA